MTMPSLPAHHNPLPGSTVRHKIVDFAKWACRSGVEPFWHYQQIRPIPLHLARTRKLPVRTDCSGFATMCCYAAGAPDPNGLAYDGAGYTGTLLKHLKHIEQAHAQPGDLIVYGSGTGHHVVVIVEAGADPLVASHGSERGPNIVRHSDELKWQLRTPGVTFLQTV